MKKALLSLMLICFAFLGVARAQETLTVYDGDATNGYVPVYGFYADAFQKVEYIMPADDLSEMMAATINKMTWYLSTPADVAWGANFQVYLMEVAETTPTAYADVSGATLVWEGALDGTGATIELEFTTPYIYEGGNLLVAVHQTVKGTYKSASFAGAAATGAAIQGYSYNSLEEVSMNTRDFLPKTTFEYTPSSGVVYYKPKNLAVSDITTTGAILTWEAGNDETSWNVEYKKATDDTWTSAGSVDVTTITLEGLANGTPYNVQVQSDYGSGNLSGWATTSFATLACEAEDMGEIAYTLTDTYGDGWNGNKLQIFLSGTDIMVAELTLPSSTSEGSGTVALCYDVDYDLVWVAGSYAYETGFLLTGPEGETIYEFAGTGSSSGPVPTAGVLTTFQIHLPTCLRPTNVAVTDVVYNGATVTWTPGADDQDHWQVAYGAGDITPETEGIDIVDATEPTYTLVGLAENTAYTVYVRSYCSDDDQSLWSNAVTFTTPLQFALPTDLEINNITAKTADAAWLGEAETYNFRYREVTGLNINFEYDGEELPDGWIPGGVNNVDNDGDGNVWRVLKITDWNMGGVVLTAADGDYCIVSESRTIANGSYVTGDNWLISGKVALTGTLSVSAADLGSDYAESFSVLVSTTGTNPDDFTVLGTENTAGALNTWLNYEYDLSSYAGVEGYVAVRHQPNGTSGYILMIDALAISGEDVPVAEWITMEGVTSPVTMEGLTPETTYEAQVQAVYADGTSQWTESVLFTTLPADAMPTDVTVTDIALTTAAVNVAGSQETYNIRYRNAAIINGIAEDFNGYETGDVPTGWTVIDSDGDGNNWYVWNLTLDDGTVQVTLSSNSYINGQGALTPDNWIITSQAPLGAAVSFDAWGQDPSYAAEIFRVYYSITGTEVDDFVPLSDDITATGTQTNYSFDLPAEAVGQPGYIALRHYNVTDQYILNVTNFYMQSDEDVPAGEWITVEDVTVPYTIEGLEMNTAYELQVQGIVDDGTTTEWTNTVSFTTLYGFGKEIAAYTEGEKDHYYLIASPVGDITAGDVVNMMENSYDLYSFSQDTDGEAHEWINGVGNASFAIEAKQGYLYANSEDVTLIFVGDAYEGDGEVTLNHTAADVPFAGWNLVGNPFGVTAYIDVPFYAMNAEGTAIEAVTRNSVDVMEGIFVYTDEYSTMTFTTEDPGKGASLAMTVNEGRGVVDRAIVRFGESSMLPKFQIFENRSSLYIPQNGKNYAVVASEGMGEMPVSFEAVNSGTYSISFNAENVEFGYLHLIDNMTGADIDLLETPSYTFDAKSSDYASRFRLVFATGNANEGSDFAYMSDGNIIVNGEGTLQVIDMTGRVLSTEQINGMARVNVNTAAGVYVLQLTNGNDVKTQKIVVK